MYKRITANIIVSNVNEILEDLHITFYGTREFWIRDSGGHILTFASSY